MSLFSRLRKLKSLSQAKSHIQKFWRAWRAVRPEFTFCMQARRMRTQSSERLLLRIWLDKVMHGLLQSRYWWSIHNHFLTSYHSQYCFCKALAFKYIFLYCLCRHFTSLQTAFLASIILSLVGSVFLLYSKWCSWFAVDKLSRWGSSHPRLSVSLGKLEKSKLSEGTLFIKSNKYWLTSRPLIRGAHK